jgi:hypothetical protein
MAKLTINQKYDSMFRLVRGMSAAPVLALIGPKGCTDEVLEQGWSLLKDASWLRFAAPGNVVSSPALDELSALQADILPVLDASLVSRFPMVHHRLFLNIGRAGGVELLVGMSVLHDRLRALYDTDDDESRAVRALLVSRSVTNEKLDRVRDLVEASKVCEMDAAIAKREEAEKKMWEFYLEWSKIVRGVVKDRRLLRFLGFLRGKKAPVAEPQPATDSLQ